MSKERIIGIDLGTTNSEAAYLEGGRPTIIPSAEGSMFGGKMFPSVVAFTKKGERLVGNSAKNQAVLNPERTIVHIKRKMGTTERIKIGNDEYSPEEISAFILQKIKGDAEAYLGSEIKKAVITVPAYFNDNQRQATKDAGKIAGLDVERIINEPTAAAMAYGLDREGESKIIVLDLGGGTFDVTIMDMGDDVFEVLATSGDTKLGGIDMDQTIIDYLVKSFKKENGIDLSNDPGALQRVRDAGEKAKIDLTNALETTINLPYLWQDSTGPKHLEVKLTRAKLEKLIDPVLKRCEGPIKRVIKDAKIKIAEIDSVILVGGPTRMPSVRERFEKIIGKKAERGIDPMQSVAMGAALQGGVLAGEVKDVLLLDVTPLTLGIETLGGISTPLIERNTTIPKDKSQIFSTAADNQPAVEIHVLQGERTNASDNVTLGRFQLIGIAPSPRGIPQIEVTFDIDTNGILHVSAKDLGTGNEQKIDITAKSTLTESEINEKIEEAEKYAEKDKRLREMVELRNQGESLIYTTDKALKDLGDKVNDDTKESVETAKKELEECLKGDDTEALRKSVEKYQEAAQTIGQMIYQQAAEEAKKEQEKNDDTSDDKEKEPNVVDADYEVVEESEE